jgi:hypothetical protein
LSCHKDCLETSYILAFVTKSSLQTCMKLFLSKFGMDQTELLMLSKQDYDNILMIQKTPELKERVRFLKVFLQTSFHLWVLFQCCLT